MDSTGFKKAFHTMSELTQVKTLGVKTTETYELCPDKVKKADNGLKNEMIDYIVSRGSVIAVILLNEQTDMQKLESLGYTERFEGKKLTFLCTEKNKHIAEKIK